MSLLSEYDARTGEWKYKPIEGFDTHENLPNKVNADGSYAPFFGCTVVFIADEQCVSAVEKMQASLYGEVGDMLASPLPVSSFHMTLHDLISPEKCLSDPSDAESYSREVEESLDKAKRLVEEIKNKYAGKQVTMEADRVVNMMRKSLVLMLRPHSEEDYQLLLDMYRPFNSIVNLDYPLTPHITLAYYRPGMIDGGRLGAAVERIQIQESHAALFVFRTEALTAQFFRDKKTYL